MSLFTLFTCSNLPSSKDSGLMPRQIVFLLLGSSSHPISSSFFFGTRQIFLMPIVRSCYAIRTIFHGSFSLVVPCSFLSLRVIFLQSLVRGLNKIESYPVAICLFCLRRNTSFPRSKMASSFDDKGLQTFTTPLLCLLHPGLPRVST
jgi:hypothetical protein